MLFSKSKRKGSGSGKGEQSEAREQSSLKSVKKPKIETDRATQEDNFPLSIKNFDKVSDDSDDNRPDSPTTSIRQRSSYSSSQRQEVTDVDDKVDQPEKEKPKPLWEEYFNPVVEGFFKKIIANFSPSNAECKKPNVNFIVVAHTVPDIFEFLRALESIGKVHTLILKSSFKDEGVETALASFCAHSKINMPKDIEDKLNQDPPPVRQSSIPETIKNQLIRDPQLGLEFVNKAAPCIILDIGGYFAPCLEASVQDTEIKQKLLGIVEDTENGHKRYELKLKELPEDSRSIIPIYSVARSEQKKTEDYNVGKSIVYNADSILRTMQVRLEDFACVGVIGFGKIGRSIADHLREKRVKKLLVYDRDPIILMQAESTDFSSATKEQILKKCRVIFCATGNKSLVISEDLKRMGDGITYIVSCTSADDEFDLRGRIAPVTIQPQGIKCKEYTVVEQTTKKTMCFLANGNAINFYLHANAIGNYIRGVQAAIISAGVKLLYASQELGNVEQTSEKATVTPTEKSLEVTATAQTSEVKVISSAGTSEKVEVKIQTLTRRDETTISKIWLESFCNIKVGTEHNRPLVMSAGKFHGRGKELEKFESIFFTQHKNVIVILNVHGESGIGKTELVNEFARKYYARYDVVWMIDMQGNKEGAYKQLAEKLGISTIGKELSELIKDIFYKLYHEKSFLLIYDNVQKDQDISGVISELQTKQPGAFQHVICISREKINIPQGNQLQVDVFSSEDADSFVTQRIPLLGEYPTYVERLTRAVGNYPILLDKITRYLKIKVSSSSSDETLSPFIDNLCNITTCVNGVAEKLSKILDYILREIEQTFGQKERWRQLLFACATLDGACIPVEMIYAIADKMSMSRKRAKSYLKEFVAYGLIGESKKDSQKVYYMHSAVQEAIRRQLCESAYGVNVQINVVISSIVDILYTKFDYQYYELKAGDINICEEYISHVKVLLSHEEYKQVVGKSKSGIELLCRFASFYLNEYREYEKSLEYYNFICGRFPQNENSIEKAIAIHGIAVNKSKLYSDKVHANPSSEDLAELRKILELAQQGQQCFKNIGQKTLFDGYPVALYTANMSITLGYIYKLMGRGSKEITQKSQCFDDAVKMLKDVVDSSEEYSPQKQSKSQLPTNLTTSTATASEKTEHLITPRVKSLAMHTLGSVVFDKCRECLMPNRQQKIKENSIKLKEARKNKDESAIQQLKKEKKQPKQEIIEQLEVAKEHLNSAVETRRECLHQQHPDLASSLQKLAAILLKCYEIDKRRTSDLKDASGFCREAMEIQSKIFSSEHHDFQETQQTLKEIQEAMKNVPSKSKKTGERADGPASSCTVSTCHDVAISGSPTTLPKQHHRKDVAVVKALSSKVCKAQKSHGHKKGAYDKPQGTNAELARKHGAFSSSKRSSTTSTSSTPGVRHVPKR